MGPAGFRIVGGTMKLVVELEERGRVHMRTARCGSSKMCQAGIAISPNIAQFTSYILKA